MGRARILESLGEGRYTIEIVEARERADVARQQAQARIAQLQAQVSALAPQISAAIAAFAAAVDEQNAAIAQYRQDMAQQGSSTINLSDTAEKVIAAAGERDKLQVEQRSLEVRIRADEALVARINALPPLRQMQAWCADYTDDLSGDVATAEVPGEIGSVIIKPGFENANQWIASSDGAIQPALAGTPASVFYNLAMQPGWQKWRPTYRTATITSIDGDTCSIALDAASSSQQGLNVNAQTSYSGVPILYMDCNGGAFEQGDRVLVAFAGNVEGPTVVGFKSEPKMCNVMDYITISDEQWSNPAIEFAFDGYFTEGWAKPEILGMPISSGNYSHTQSISKDGIDIAVGVSHQDSISYSFSAGENDFGPVSVSASINHTCQATGSVSHLGRAIDLSYRASLSHNISYSFITDLFDYIPPARRTEVTSGFFIALLATNAYTSQPFATLSETLTIGGYAVDLRKLNEHLYLDSGVSSAAEWISYFPTNALDASSSVRIKGTTKPFNILLPDIVSFASGGQRGVLLVFSSTGPITSSASFGAGYEVLPEPYISGVRFNNNFLTRYFNHGHSVGVSANNRLDDRKIHVYVTLIEQEGAFVRGETPSEALNHFKEEKVRGNGSDSYYELPLSVDISA